MYDKVVAKLVLVEVEGEVIPFILDVHLTVTVMCEPGRWSQSRPSAHASRHLRLCNFYGVPRKNASSISMFLESSTMTREHVVRR